MNTKNLIAAVAILAAAGSALAEQTVPYVDFTGFRSTMTRAEVKADLQAAQADGNFVAGGREVVAPDAAFVARKSRAQVVAELERSQADGSYALARQEYEGQFPPLGASSASLLAGTGKAANLN